MRAKQSAGDLPITPLLGVFGYEILSGCRATL